MKFPLRSIVVNRFRNLSPYVLDQKKVERLKASIRTTGFWDNLLCRKHCACAELAYGHHRLLALTQLADEHLIDLDYEVDMIVRELDSSAMVRIMAAENPCNLPTVLAVRQFISDEVREPIAAITASDIAQFVGGDWQINTVYRLLRKATGYKL